MTSLASFNVFDSFQHPRDISSLSTFSHVSVISYHRHNSFRNLVFRKFWSWIEGLIILNLIDGWSKHGFVIINDFATESYVSFRNVLVISIPNIHFTDLSHSIVNEKLIFVPGPVFPCSVNPSGENIFHPLFLNEFVNCFFKTSKVSWPVNNDVDVRSCSVHIQCDGPVDSKVFKGNFWFDGEKGDQFQS